MLRRAAAVAVIPVKVYVGAAWTTDAPYRETEQMIAERKAQGILAVEMESAALYAFATARGRPVICLAHVSNQLGYVEGDFEKGEGNGARWSAELVRSIAGSKAAPYRVPRPQRRELRLSLRRMVSLLNVEPVRRARGTVLVVPWICTCPTALAARTYVAGSADARLGGPERGLAADLSARGFLHDARGCAGIAGTCDRHLCNFGATTRLCGGPTVEMPGWAYGLAALLAVIPTLAILPKETGDGVALAGPMFDHAKVAIIDDMARLGLPPGNPFFGAAGDRLAYYYLWYFGAAQFARVLGISGWEADVAMTWFSAFASLTLMMGLAAWFAARASQRFGSGCLALAARCDFRSGC